MNKKDYSEPFVSDRNGDLSKNWFVEFTYYFSDTICQRYQIKNGGKFGLKNAIINGNSLKSKKERYAYFRNLCAEISNLLKNGFVPPSDKFFVDVKKKYNIITALEFALNQKSAIVKPYTLSDYKQRVGQFLKWLTVKKKQNDCISKLTKVLLLEFLDEVCKESSNANFNSSKRSLSAIFTVLVDYEIMSDNICKKIKNRQETQKLHRPYPAEIRDKVLSYCKENEPTLFLILILEYYCLMRISDIRRARVSDIDFEKGKIMIQSGNTKNKKTRFVPLHPDLITALKNKVNFDGEYILGKHYRRGDVDNAWKRVRNAIKLEIGYTTYGFKHEGCAKLYELTKDIYYVSQICGHSSTKVTERYLRSLGVDLNNDDAKLIESII